jgi:hypothetical protein
MRSTFRERLFLCLLAVVTFCLPACNSMGDGHFSLFGYTTRPNYDPGIRTVYVPIFKNETFYKNLEFELTKAVIREIEEKTPYKVVSCCEEADTELLGKIVNFNKTVLITNQLNEIRDGQTMLSVEILWRDLRPGYGDSILSRQGRAPLPDPLAPPPDPNAPPPPPVPVLVQSVATFQPEIGGSLVAAQKQNFDRLAVQIVSMMEVWDDTICAVPIAP